MDSLTDKSKALWTMLGGVRSVDTTVFAFFTVVSCVCLVVSVTYAIRRRDVMGFLLMPAVCICITYENVIFAIGDLNDDVIAVEIGKPAHAMVVPFSPI